MSTSKAGSTPPRSPHYFEVRWGSWFLRSSMRRSATSSLKRSPRRRPRSSATSCIARTSGGKRRWPGLPDSSTSLHSLQKLASDDDLRTRLGCDGYFARHGVWSEAEHLERYFALIDEKPTEPSNRRHIPQRKPRPNRRTPVATPTPAASTPTLPSSLLEARPILPSFELLIDGSIPATWRISLAAPWPLARDLSRRRYGFATLFRKSDRTVSRGELHVACDEGCIPTTEQSKIRWEGCDGSMIDATTRIPLATESARSYLRFPSGLAQSMQQDQTAAVIWARWPEVRSPSGTILSGSTRTPPFWAASSPFAISSSTPTITAANPR